MEESVRSPLVRLLGLISIAIGHLNPSPVLRESSVGGIFFNVYLIYDCLLQTKSKFLPSEGISQAINYTLKFWKELTLFLDDLSLPLSNNDAERALRHIVMGRKNFGGSKTINGADVAATLYTVIESAKKVGLQPKEYIKYVIMERWYKREPKSPAEVSLERFGRNTRVIYPPKDQWRVNQ